MRMSPLRAVAAVVPAFGLVLLAPSPAAAAPPPNDDFDAAVEITELPFETSTDTSEATRAEDDPACVGQDGSTVWYTLTLPERSEMAVDTFGSDYNTTLSVWTGTRGDLRQVGCNDNAGDGLQSRVVFEAEADVTYHIMVGSVPTAPGGDLVLSAQQAPPPMELAVTLDPTGSVTDDGAAVIHGMVSCSRPAELVARGTLRQQTGGGVTVGAFRTTVPCDGVDTWEATVLGETGVYQPGTATGVAAVEFTDPLRDEVVEDQATGQVQLR